jgi:hypothetical protein
MLSRLKGICCFSLIMLFSCESHEQSADAFEIVKEDRNTFQTLEKTPIKIIPDPKRTAPIERTKSLDEWSEFKTQIDAKIASNQHLIKVLKNQHSASTKTFRRITHLEEQNTLLNEQLLEYYNNERMKWLKFKDDINQQVTAIESELGDTTIFPKK